MHVLGEPTNERFVGFNLAAHLQERAGLHCQPDAVIHEPSRLLSDTERPVHLYTPAEALEMATADNGELMALSGFINPYPGKLGVVEVGALADLLLVDGDPLENIKLLEDPDKKILVIMKDGTIYKNTLPK